MNQFPKKRHYLKIKTPKFQDGGFIDYYKHGDIYKDSKECAYFSNHALNSQGYMMSGDAWRPRGNFIIFNGFEGFDKPKQFDEKSYDEYNRKAVKNVYDNFITRKTLVPEKVYTVNMFYKKSPNKNKAFTEGDNVYGTHTGYLSYNKKDDTWYVTHNINGIIHKDKFGSIQNSNGNIGVTAIYEPRKYNLLNRAITALGFENGGTINRAYYS